MCGRIDRNADRLQSRRAKDRLDVVRTEDDSACSDLSHELDSCESEWIFMQRTISERVGHLSDRLDANPHELRGRRHRIGRTGIHEKDSLVSAVARAGPA